VHNTMWGGVQPARYDLTSGMGRRFMYLLFLPSRDEAENLLEAWFHSKNIVPDSKTIEKLWAKLKVFKHKIEDIKSIEFSPELLEEYKALGIYPYEGTIFDRLILGTQLMLDFGSKVEVSLDDPIIRDLVNKERSWRRQVAIGGEFRQILKMLEDQPGKQLSRSEMTQDCLMLGWDIRKMMEVVLEMQKLRLVSVSKDYVTMV